MPFVVVVGTTELANGADGIGFTLVAGLNRRHPKRYMITYQKGIDKFHYLYYNYNINKCEGDTMKREVYAGVRKSNTGFQII